MDPQQIKELLLALRLELIRYKEWCLAIFIIVSSTILFMGYTWPQTYQASAVLHAAETNIIGPLLKGRAEVGKINPVQTAKEIVYTRQFLEEVLIEANWADTTTGPERMEGLVKILRATIKVDPVGKEYFRLTYKSPDQDKTYETLVATVNTFIAYTSRQKKEESYAAYKFIDSQVEAYKRQLEEAEENLKNFKSKNVEGNEETVTRRISDLRSEIESLDLNKVETSSRISALKKQLDNESNYLQVRNRLDELEERKLNLNRDLETLRLTYQDNYPDIVSIKSQIIELDSAIDKIYLNEGMARGSKGGEGENPLYEELRIRLSAARVEYRALNQRYTSLNKLLERELKRAEKIAENEASLAELTRDYDVTKNVYEEMLERKENARLSMVLDIEGQGISYQIHEPAVYPHSSVGIKFINFALVGPILGFLIPIGLVIAYIMLDPRMRMAGVVKDNFSDVGFFLAVPHCSTALGTRIMRRDAVILLSIAMLFISFYIGFVAIEVTSDV